MAREYVKSLLFLITVIGVTMALLADAARAEPVSTVKPITLIVVRHAEKSNDAAQDPPLSYIGQERARRLGRVLRDVGVAAVYVSDTRRAKETAEPITDSLGLAAEIYPGRAVNALLERSLKEHVGQTILIVGHSNTVPEMISLLTRGRESVALRDDEYDALFIVIIGDHDPPSLLRLRY